MIIGRDVLTPWPISGLGAINTIVPSALILIYALGLKTTFSGDAVSKPRFRNEKLISIPPPDSVDTLRKFLLEIVESITITILK